MPIPSNAMLSLSGDVVIVRLPSPPGDTFADFLREVEPGESWNGVSYDDLKEAATTKQE